MSLRDVAMFAVNIFGIVVFVCLTIIIVREAVASVSDLISDFKKWRRWRK